MDVHMVTPQDVASCPILWGDGDWAHSPLSPLAPLASATVSACPAVSGSEALQHPHSRLRLVEGAVFAGAVLLVVLVAAVDGVSTR